MSPNCGWGIQRSLYLKIEWTFSSYTGGCTLAYKQPALFLCFPPTFQGAMLYLINLSLYYADKIKSSSLHSEWNKNSVLDCDTGQTLVSTACSFLHVIIYIKGHHQKCNKCLQQYSAFNQRNMHWQWRGNDVPNKRDVMRVQTKNCSGGSM